MAIKDSAYNSKPAKLPGLPEVPRSLDAPTYRLLEAIKEHLEVRNGGRGNVFERAVTERRLTEFIESPEFRQVVVSAQGAQGSSAAPFVPTRPATAFDITAEVRRALDRLKSSAPPSQTENLIGALRQELMGLLSGATSERSVALAMTNEARLRANAVATEAAVRAQALAQEQSDRAQAVADEATARVAGIAQSTLGWSEGLVTEARVRANQIDLNANSILRAALASDNARTDAAASLAVAKSTLETTIEDGISAEIVSRETLAVQLRGAYTGADLNAVSSGLFHQERTARVTAVESLTQQITLLSAGAGEQFDWNRIWYFDTGTESWSGNGTPTAAAGYLRPANQASGAYVESPVGVGSDGTQYGEVRLRVRKTGAPVFAGLLWWRGVGDSTWDSARRVALTEPSFDDNGIGLITASPGWTVVVDRLRIDLSSAQTGTDFFELDWVALGRPSPGASSAQLFNEQVVRANADGALASDISTLTAKTDANLAALNVEQIARASADAALASQSLALVASVGQSASALKSEQEVRSRADEAQASQVFGLSAVLGENLSGILVEQQARTTADAATASQLSSVVAGLGNAQAGVVAEQQARATADAANASNAITLSAALGESVAALRVEQQARATADAATASSLSTLVVGTASGLQASIETLQGVTADLSTASAQSSTTLVSLSRQTDASLDDLAEAALRNALGADRALGFFSETLALATTQLKTNIEEGVSAEAELRSLLVAQVGDNLGVFESYVLTQADANSATTTSLGLLSAQTQDNQSAILLEQSVRTDENSATTSLIEGVTASVGDVASAVLSEQQARATEQAATTSTLQVLTAITAGNTAAVVSEQQARTTQEQSVALAVSALTAATGNSVASIVSEQFARTTSIEAVALLAQTLSVQVSGSTAAVSTESTARASLGSALAGLVQSVGVRLDSGDFASVKAVTQASANAVDGLSAQYTLKVNTNGKIAGFDISSTSPVVGPSTSAFVIVADKFVIASSGEADGHIPFGIDTVTGNIFLSGAVRINAGGNTLATLATNAAEMAMTFIGSYASAPSTAGLKKNNVYRNTTTGTTFILSADNGVWLPYLDGGVSTAVVYAYKRSATNPTTGWSASTQGPGAITWTFAANAITTPSGNALSNGWVKAIPTGEAPLYVTACTASSTTTTDAVAASEWATPALLASNGLDGLNVATAILYRRTGSATAPPPQANTVTFTFATGGMTGMSSGWTQSVPSALQGAYLWVTQATASSITPTDTLPASEWSPPVMYTQDGNPGGAGDAVDIVFIRSASQPSQPAASAGTPTGWFTNVASVPVNNNPLWSMVGKRATGAANYTWNTPVRIDGSAVAEVTIFQRSASALGAVSGGSYTFGQPPVLTPPSGWSTSVPAGTNPVYTSRAVVSAPSGVTAAIAITGWTTPVVSLQNGTNGTDGTNGRDGTPGTNGSRGSITLYRTGAYSDAEATAAILAVTNTANVMGDTVTFTSGSVSTTRYWDLTAWASPGVVIDGNLLVSGSVSAGSLKANSGNFLGPVRADQQLGEASGVTLGVHQAQPTILGNDFELGSGLTSRWRVGVLGHAVLSTPALGGNNNAGAVAVAGVSGGNGTARASFGGYFEAQGGNDGAGVFGKHLGFSTINLSASPVGVRGDAVPYLVNGTSANRRAFGVYGSVNGWCTPGDGAGVFAQGRRDLVGGNWKETPGLRVEGQLFWYGVGGLGATLVNSPTTFVTDVLRGNGTWGSPERLASRPGGGGTTGPNHFYAHWTGTTLELWIDNTRIIRLTPSTTTSAWN